MRLFVALWPPPEVMARLGELERPAIDGVRWTRPDQWHLTLRFLGEMEDPAPVLAALEAVSLPGSELTLGSTTSALGRTVLVVPVTGAAELAGVVTQATAEMGEAPDRRGFHGHLTLARVRGRRSGSSLRRLAGATVGPARWSPSQLSVVESRPHSDGSRYHDLARLPLGS